MASSPDPTPSPVRTTGAIVRRNALWAVGAAGIMLYYGFWNVVLDEPSAGELLLVYTLRIGGILMTLSALLSFVGLRPALAFDALASAAIGLALLVDAALLYTDYPTQALLNVLFGAVFLHSGGYRNWEEYRWLAPLAAPASADEKGSDSLPQRSER